MPNQPPEPTPDTQMDTVLRELDRQNLAFAIAHGDMFSRGELGRLVARWLLREWDEQAVRRE